MRTKAAIEKVSRPHKLLISDSKVYSYVGKLIRWLPGAKFVLLQMSKVENPCPFISHPSPPSLVMGFTLLSQV